MAKRMTGALLCAAMILTLLAGGASAAWQPEAAPAYVIGGSFSDGVMTAEVWLENANAVSGSIALKFDAGRLRLKNAETLAGAVKAGDGVSITTGGLGNDQVISQEEGFLLVSWFPSGNRLDASGEAKLVFSAEFEAEGVTAENADSSLLRLFDLQPGQISGFSDSAFIFADVTPPGGETTGRQYRYNRDSNPTCLVRQSYPGSERASAQDCQVTFEIKDYSGKPVAADIITGGSAFKAGKDGNLTLKLPQGTYSCQIFADGLENLIKTYTASGTETRLEITLKSDQLVAQTVADQLQITYAVGDSADHVSASVGLPRFGPANTRVSWNSSNSTVVDRFGGVFPQEEAQTVELTATVSCGSATAEKTFTLKVVPKAQENPNPDYPDEGGEEEKPEPKPGFQDLAGFDWASQAILELAAQGIINGTSETTFEPSGSITRADFTCLVVRMLAPEGELATEPFKDVSTSSYYYEEVMRAKALGIAKGGEDGMFRPEDRITRQDMTVLVYRALLAMDLIEAPGSLSALDGHNDGNQVADYAREAMAAALEKGLIVGDQSGSLNPLQNTTRAEAAVFIHRILEKIVK